MKSLITPAALALALGALGVGGVALAHGHRGGGHQAILTAMDANNDGRVSRQEVDAHIRIQFTSADTNRNGGLSQDELRTHHEARIAERRQQRTDEAPPPAPPEDRRGRNRPTPEARFNQIDWNLDGAVSFDEFAAGPRAMAARADRNGDGVIVQDEARPPQDHGRRHGRGRD